MMNLFEIEKALKYVIKGTPVKSAKVYHVDDIKQQYIDAPSPKIHIINIKSHWLVCCCMKKGRNIIYDSYGKDPLFYSTLFSVIDSPFQNCVQIQDLNSNVCGMHCLYFAYCIARNKSFCQILNSFSYDYNSNDVLVRNFYNNNVKPFL